MPKITFIDFAGASRTIDAENGATVMETAIKNDVPGIEAECGGACACATCHVYVDEAWREKVGAPTPMEEDMLDFGFDAGNAVANGGFHHGGAVLDVHRTGFALVIDKVNFGHVCSCCRDLGEKGGSELSYNGSIRPAP